jgi:D-amino-acid dehydrogenase
MQETVVRTDSAPKHLIVAGAGIIGLSVAYYAAMKGHRVTILERDSRGHDCCSVGNAGMIVPSHFIPLAAPGVVPQALKWMWDPESPFYIKPRLSSDLAGWGLKFWRAATASHVRRSAPLLRDLHLASRACYEELAERSDDFGLVREGLLMLCRTPHGLEEEAATAEKARRLGIPAEVIDARRTAELDPGIRMDAAGAVYYPRDCHLTPQRLMARLTHELEGAGAEFIWHADVTGWRTGNGRVDAALTNRGEIAGDEYVLACGSWSPGLVRDLRLHVPMQAGKGYSLTLSNPRQMPKLCSICTEARIAVTPMGSSLRFGGTMEISGLDTTVNHARVRGIIKAVPHYFPDFSQEDFAGIQPWRGLRPCSPDGLPYVGRTARWKNFLVATGHAMMGVSLAPITGKLVAEIVSGEQPSIDISGLSPDRYC